MTATLPKATTEAVGIEQRTDTLSDLAKALEVARDELSNRIDQRLDRADLDDLSQIRAIVDLYFEDWGSTKADRWKALTGEPLGGGEAAMRIIQRILR